MKLKVFGEAPLSRILWVASLCLMAFFAIAQELAVGEDERTKKLSPLALKMLDRRVEELTQKKLDECKQKAIVAAEIYVDSLIIREATQNRVGVDGIPNRPLRPNVPTVILEADSMDIGPLFKEEEEEGGNNN